MIDQLTRPRHLANPIEAVPTALKARHRAPDTFTDEPFLSIGQQQRAESIKVTRPIAPLPLIGSSLSTPDSLIFTVGDRTALREILELDDAYKTVTRQELRQQEHEMEVKSHSIRSLGSRALLSILRPFRK